MNFRSRIKDATEKKPFLYKTYEKITTILNIGAICSLL